MESHIKHTLMKEAAQEVIHYLKCIQELQQCKIIIIGGVALQQYIDLSYCSTKDIDILIVHPDRPIDSQMIRKRLVSEHPTLFEERAQPLFFRYNLVHQIQVDIIPEYLPPYLPGNAVILHEADPRQPPFISPLDVLAYKIHCCSMRPSFNRRRKDANGAADLAKSISVLGGITLDQSQKQAVLSGLGEMMQYSTKTRDWWERILGLNDCSS